MSRLFTSVYNAVGSTESFAEPGEEDSYNQEPMDYQAPAFTFIPVPLHHLT